MLTLGMGVNLAKVPKMRVRADYNVVTLYPRRHAVDRFVPALVSSLPGSRGIIS